MASTLWWIWMRLSSAGGGNSAVDLVMVKLDLVQEFHAGGLASSVPILSSDHSVLLPLLLLYFSQKP